MHFRGGRKREMRKTVCNTNANMASDRVTERENNDLLI